MKRPRRSHSAAFKEKGALIALKDEWALAQLAQRFGQIKSRLLHLSFPA